MKLFLRCSHSSFSLKTCLERSNEYTHTGLSHFSNIDHLYIILPTHSSNCSSNCRLFWRESAFFISFYIYSFKKTVSFCGVVFFFHFFLQNYMHIMILLLSSSSPFYNLNDSDQQIILRLTEGCNHFYHCYPHVIGCTQDTK